MNPGIYYVTFSAATTDFGWGLVVVDNGKLHGGDLSYLYRGRYEVNAGILEASIQVSHYQGALNSVFGPLKSFSLILVGNLTQTGFSLSGHVEGQPRMTITILGEKKADLV